MPRHVLVGFIHGEIVRYIKRCSSVLAFFTMLRLFWTRLSVRGYPAAFLRNTFNSAADYVDRAVLLAKPVRKASAERSQVMIVTFSRALHQAQLGRILHEYRYLLPPQLQEQKVIVAWRAPKKIGGMLIPFRSDTSRIDEDTPLVSRWQRSYLMADAPRSYSLYLCQWRVSFFLYDSIHEVLRE